jgi:hypothetical protein
MLSVQCCADGPPAPIPVTPVIEIPDDSNSNNNTNSSALRAVSFRKLLQEPSEDSNDDADPPEDSNDDAEPDVESAESSLTAASLPALEKMRFTNGTGTAQSDEQCSFPFIYDGLSYNNCTSEGRDVGEHGWCPIANEYESTKTKNGIILVTEDTVWGGCARPGYVPPKCVVSPWRGWELCSAVCGGGTQSRHREIISNTGDDALCGETTQVHACNIHECGHVETIAGGKADGSGKVGIGYANSPLNDLWIRRKQGGPAPDLHFNPWAITVNEERGSDVIYATGEPRSRADYMSLIRQIQVTPFTPSESGGAGSLEECPRVDHISEPDQLPISSAQCRLLGSGHVAEVIGDGFPSEGAASVAIDQNQQLFTAINGHKIGKVEMSLGVKCENWMSQKLDLWDVATDGESEHSAPILLPLRRTRFGEATVFRFEAIRKVASITSLGLSQRYAEDSNGATRTFSKNQMCITQHGDEAHETKCCLLKEATAAPLPPVCPAPVATDCALARQIDMLDYEYANFLIAGSSWA